MQSEMGCADATCTQTAPLKASTELDFTCFLSGYAESKELELVDTEEGNAYKPQASATYKDKQLDNHHKAVLLSMHPLGEFPGSDMLRYRPRHTSKFRKLLTIMKRPGFLGCAEFSNEVCVEENTVCEQQMGGSLQR